jgi:LysM repeat protein
VIGRSFARLLALGALVACAVALFAIVTSGGDHGSEGTSSALTATPTAKPKAKRKKAAKKTYVVKTGDTPSSIADAQGVSLADLLAANPDIEPRALAPGDKLIIP